MNSRIVHSVRIPGRSPILRSGIRTLCIALLLASANVARADCPAAPLGSTDDLVVSFLAGQGGTQAATSTLFASTVKEGMLVYDDTNNALKVCNGTTWQTLAVGGAGVTAAGTVAGTVQFRGSTGNLEADDTNFVWDDTNNRLGIGTSTPTYTLQIEGAGGGANIAMRRNNAVIPTSEIFTMGTSAGAITFGTNLKSYNGDFQFFTDSTPNDTTNNLAPTVTFTSPGNVGIGTATPASTALLDITSTTKGLLLPRLTTAQVTTLSGLTPADGMIVYDTDTDTIKLRANGAWVDLMAGAGSEADPQVGTLTASKWCSANVGGTAIDCTADAPATGAAGAASEVQFRNSGTGAFAANSSFVWDNTNKRLGIGTAGPSNELHVVSTMADAKAAQFEVTGTHDPTTTGMAGIMLTNIDNTTSSLWGLTFSAYDTTDIGRHASAIAAGKESDWVGGSANYAGYLGFWTRPAGGEDIERLRITSTGNVGIGTTAPDWKLHIVDAVAPVIELDETDSGGKAFIGVDGNNLFVRRGTIGTADALTISSTGKVGIGTATPYDKLHVHGGRALIQNGSFNDTTGNKAWLHLATDDWIAGNYTSSPAVSLYVDTLGTAGLAFHTYTGSAQAQRMTITAAGNVGIGTASPGAKLGVDGDISLQLPTNNVDKGIYWGAAGAVGYGRIYRNSTSGALWIDAQANAPILLNAGTSGNVGIGTANPLSKLHITTASALTTFATNPSQENIQLQNSSSTANNWSEIVNYSSSGAIAGGIGFQNVDHTNAYSSIAFYTRGSTASWGERLRIDSNGNVGIGTNSPAYKLDVAGDANFSDRGGFGIVPASSGAQLGVSPATSTRDGIIVFSSDPSYSGDMIEARYGGTPMTGNLLKLAINNSADTKFIVTGAGNVGIGTATPSQKLDVVGGFTLKGSSGSYLWSQRADSEFDISLPSGSTKRGISLHASTSGSSGSLLELYGHNGTAYGIAMSVTNPGNVGIGTVSPTTKLQIDSSGINNHILLKSGAQTWGVFNDGSSFVIGNGAAGAYGTGVYIANGGQSWNALSDRSLKSEVKTLSVLSRLKDYRAVSYVFNPSGRREIGVVAQELQPLFPELVSKSPNGLLGVSYDRLGAIALEGVKELKADNDNLRAELKAANDNQGAADELERWKYRQEIDQLKAANDEQGTAIDDLRQELKALKASR